MSLDRIQELVLSATALLWALLLALPDDVLGRVRAYSAINRFASDGVWSLLLAACALTILIARPWMGWRAQAHAVLGILWLIIVILLFSSGLRVTTVLLAAPFMALALLHIFQFFRLSQLARFS